MHPAVRADPFRAAFDVAMSTRNDHFDVARVFQVEAVLGAGIPHGVVRREFARALDLARAVVIETQTPVRDIHVMPHPVEQLPAAGVVVPAPVFVHLAFPVRHHLRRPDPGVVIQFDRWRR